MADTAQPLVAAETDPIAAASEAFKTFDPSSPAKEEKPRGPDGKFVSAHESEQEIEAEDEAQAEPEAETQAEELTDEADDESQPAPVELPTSWAADKAELWETLPPEAQDYIKAREGERDTAVNAKFQEAANLRKANEVEINEAKANRQMFAEAADFVLSLAHPQKPPTSMLDPNSSDYNPDAYHLGNRKYEEQVGIIQAVGRQRAQIAQQEQTEQEAARQTRVAEINEKAMPDLIKLVPDFSDEAKAPTAFMDLAKYALSEGVPEETQLSDFTAVELKVLAKARKYDEMMAAKAKVTPKAPRPAAPVVRPGVTTPRAAIEQQKAKQALQRLETEGSVESGAAAFLALTPRK